MNGLFKHLPPFPSFVLSPKWLLGSLALSTCTLAVFTQPARSEGSRELVANGGDRPFLEYRDDSSSGIPRRSIIKVYVIAGETLNLGSSVDNAANGQDIVYRSPTGQEGSCDVNTSGFGYIDTLAKEDAGPLPATGGYTPCTVPVTQTGIWEIEFRSSPNPNSAANPISTPANQQWTQPTTNGYIAAWDVTVSSATGVPIPGRAYANYLALNLGGNGRSLNSNVVTLTKEGYQYQIDLNGLDPFGFIFFANNSGFKDPSNNPIFRSLQFVGPNTDFTFPSGYSVHNPSIADTSIDITHKLFFNNPDLGLPPSAPSPSGQTWLLQPPVAPPQPDSFTFTGIEGTAGQAGTSPLGGNFSFNNPGSTRGTYQITLDFNNNGIADGNDRIIIGRASSGTNSVFWDGRDADGVVVPASNIAYNARIVLFAGEAHFPFIDPENNPNGLIITRLNDPASPTIPTPEPDLVYYDDRNTGSNFTLCANGETGGDCYGNPLTTAANPRSALAGVNSSGGVHRWGNNFGDRRGMDTWVYYPSQAVELVGGILVKEADLSVSKTDGQDTIVAGSPITYTIIVKNNGLSDVTGAIVSDSIPSSIINVSWTCTPSVEASCTNGTGNVINDSVNLPNDGSVTYVVSGIVSPTATGTISNTATITRPNDVNDPDLSNNTALDTTTIVAAPPKIGVAKQAGTPVANPDGSFTIPYTMVIKNLGGVALSNVQVDEDLTQVFAAPATFGISSAPTGDGIAANPAFTGTANGSTNLLSENQTLAVGEIAAVSLEVRVVPNNNFGPYTNQVTANATDANGTPTTDLSDNGADPDPNGNGNPDDPDENDPTVVTLPQTPRIGAAKQVVNVTDNGNGTFAVTYDIAVENLGNTPLNNVQIIENFAETFAGATGFSVNSVEVTSGNLTANTNFNGNNDTNLLAPAQTLALGETANISVAITVTPGNNLGSYENTAIANGTSPEGTPVSDESDDGTNPDPNGNGNPDDPGENDPTPLNFAETPRVGVAKRIVSVINNNNGTFNVGYEIRVQNYGDVPLNSLQVRENLAAAFGTTPFSLVSPPTSTTLSLNGGYNGSNDTNLLAGNDTLEVNAFGLINFTLQVTPGNNLGPYNNIATATGIGPAGTTVTDDSTDGTNPDVGGNNSNPNNDGDNNPNNNTAPTSLNLAEMPRVGVAKQAGTIVNNNDGTYTVPYMIAVQNYGDVALSNLQITENLFGNANSTFNGAQAIAITTPPTITSGSLTATNPNFNGNSDQNLLSGTQTLAVGQRTTLMFSVRITPGNNFGPYNNIATASATGPTGTNVTDDSTDGTNPDVGGNSGNPGNDNDNNPNNNTTFTTINLDGGEPRLRLVKRITAVNRNGILLNGLNFNTVVDVAGDDDNATDWPQNFLTGLPKIEPDRPLQSGDEVEYTIYFLSDGGTSANNVRFCDPIPTGTTFLPNSFGGGRGILLRQDGVDAPQSNASDTDKGRFFSPLAPVTTPSCPDLNNPNGAVVLQLGNITNTVPNQVGFVRFRVKID